MSLRFLLCLSVRFGLLSLFFPVSEVGLPLMGDTAEIPVLAYINAFQENIATKDTF